MDEIIKQHTIGVSHINVPADHTAPPYVKLRDEVIDFVGPQTKKLFFVPYIFIRAPDQENNFILAYVKDGEIKKGNVSFDIWSGRVLLGQTIREGIFSELQKEIAFSGGKDDFQFFPALIEQWDHIKDNNGNDTLRIRLDIFISVDFIKSISSVTKVDYVCRLLSV